MGFVAGGGGLLSSIGPHEIMDMQVDGRRKRRKVCW